MNSSSSLSSDAVSQVVLQAYELMLEPSTSADKRREAFMICEEFKNESSRCLPLCVQWISSSVVQARYFALHCFDHFIRTKGSRVPPEDLIKIRDVIIGAIGSNAGKDRLSNQMACGCLARIGIYLYPKQWPSMFSQFLDLQLFDAIQIFFEDVFTYDYLNSRPREKEIMNHLQIDFLPMLLGSLPHACPNTQKSLISVGLNIIKTISGTPYVMSFKDVIDTLIKYLKDPDLRMDAIECLLGICSSTNPKGNKMHLCLDERFMKFFCDGASSGISSGTNNNGIVAGDDCVKESGWPIDFARSKDEDDLFFTRKLAELFELIVGIESSLSRLKSFCSRGRNSLVEYIALVARVSSDRSVLVSCLSSIMCAGIDSVPVDKMLQCLRHGCSLLVAEERISGSNAAAANTSNDDLDDYESQRTNAKMRDILQRFINSLGIDALLQSFDLTVLKEAKDEAFLVMICNALINHISAAKGFDSSCSLEFPEQIIRRGIDCFLTNFQSADCPYSFKVLIALTGLAALVFGSSDRSIPEKLVDILLSMQPISVNEPAQAIATLCLTHQTQMKEFRAQIYKKLQSVDQNFPLIQIEYISQAAIIVSDDGAGLDEATSFILAPAKNVLLNPNFQESLIKGSCSGASLAFSLLTAVCRSHATVRRWSDLTVYMEPFAGVVSAIALGFNGDGSLVEKAYRLCGYVVAGGLMNEQQIQILIRSAKDRPIELMRSAIKSISKCLLIQGVPCSIEVQTSCFLSLLEVVPAYLETCVAQMSSSGAKPEDEASMETQINRLLRTYTDILRKSVLSPQSPHNPLPPLPAADGSSKPAADADPAAAVKRVIAKGYVMSLVMRKILQVDLPTHTDRLKHVAMRFFMLLTVRDASSVGRLVTAVQLIAETLYPNDLDDPIEAFQYCLTSLKNNHDNQASLQYELCKLTATVYKLHLNVSGCEDKMDTLIQNMAPNIKKENITKVKSGLTTPNHNSRMFKQRMQLLLAGF